jgi:hypothetical protein
MKPNPFSGLNHFTVPFSLAIAGHPLELVFCSRRCRSK